MNNPKLDKRAWDGEGNGAYVYSTSAGSGKSEYCKQFRLSVLDEDIEIVKNFSPTVGPRGFEKDWNSQMAEALEAAKKE